MKKQKASTTLALSRETLKVLDGDMLLQVDGARPPPTKQSDCDAECRTSRGAC